MTPQCPVHNRPMKQFPWGFKCTAVIGKNPDGSNQYCPQKAKPGEVGPGSQAGAKVQPGASSGDLRVVALECASRLFSGSNDLQATTLGAEALLAWLRGDDRGEM